MPLRHRSRLFVRALEERITPASVLIHSGTSVRDLVWDSTRQRLYFSDAAGVVHQYSSGAVSQLLTVAGGSFNGIDITPSGGSLLVTDATTASATTGRLHRIDLTTKANTTLTYTREIQETGTWDVSAVGETVALFTTSFAGSGFTPLRQVDLNTDVISKRSDVSSVNQDSFLSRSGDYSRLILTLSNTSGGPMRIYTSATDGFSAVQNANYSLSNVRAALSREGGLAAVETGSGIGVLTADGLIPRRPIANLDGGVTFDPARDILYGVVSATDQLVAYSTTTWDELYRLPIGENVAASSGFGSGGLVVASGAAYLITATGVRRIDLPGATPVGLRVEGFPSFGPAGIPGEFTVTALNADGSIHTGFVGEVVFASNGGGSTLPAAYTFTPADQGRRTFTATFPNAGLFNIVANTSGFAAAGQSNIQVFSGPHTQSLSIPAGEIRDAVFHSGTQTVYFTTNNGTVGRYHTTSGRLLSPWRVGADLLGIDATPDGNSLIVAEGQHCVLGGVAYRIDVNTGAVQSLGYSGDHGSYDVAAMSNNSALITAQSPNTSQVKIRGWNLATNAITPRADIPSIQGGSSLSRSFGGTLGLVVGGGSSRGDIRTYAANSNQFGGVRTLNGLFDSAPASISRDGQHVAIKFNDGVSVFRPDYSAVEHFAGLNGGTVFDSARDRLYAFSSVQDQMIAFDTATWTERYRISVGVDVGEAGNFGTGVTVHGGDAVYLVTASGMRRISLPSDSGPANRLVANGFPTFSQVSTPGSITVAARTPDGAVDTGFTGTVSFASTDPFATLPAHYTFTPADQGVKAFPVIFSSVGNHSLIVSTPGLSGSTQSGIIVHAVPNSSSLTIPISDAKDQVFDPVRGILYISTARGVIERFDPATRSLLPGWNVGSGHFGIDVTPDGNTVVVMDAFAGATGHIVRRVDVDTGAVSRVSYVGDDGPYDVVVTGPGHALFTSRFNGSGSVSLREWNLTSNTIAVRNDLPSGTRKDSLLDRSADRSHVLISETNALRVFTTATNKFSTSVSTSRNIAQSAISPDGVTFGTVMDGNASFFAKDYKSIENLRMLEGGMAFDPVRDLIHGIDTQTDHIIAYDTSNWRERYRVPLGVEALPAAGFGTGRIELSYDGRHAFAMIGGSIRVLPLPLDTFIASKIRVSEYPAFLPVDTSAEFVVEILDAAGNAVTDFTGSVTFSASSAATLPTSYTFTQADQGRKSFTASFSIVGSAASLTVSSTGLTPGSQSGIQIHNNAIVNLIPVADYRGMVYDAGRDLLYIANPHGVIERYSPSRRMLLAPIGVGGSPRAIEMAPDGGSVLVADSLAGATGSMVRRVSLTNSTVVRLPFFHQSNEAGTYDIVAMANDVALFTTSFRGSGTVPFRQVQLATNVISLRTDVTSIQQDTTIARNASRTTALIAQAKISSAPVRTYSAGSNTISGSLNTNAVMTGPTAVSRTGSQAAVEVGSTIRTFNVPLAATATLSGPNAGMVFDPIHDRMYAGQSNGTITVYNTSTWTPTSSISLSGVTIPSTTSFTADAMTISDNGHWLFVAAVGGIHPRFVGTASVAGFVIDSGTQRSMVRSATVNFSAPVSLGAGAITVTTLSGLPVGFTLSHIGSSTTIQFTGGSLPDGRYRIVVNGEVITDPQGSPLVAGAQTEFHRLLGDSNGDATIDFADLLAFRLAFASTSPIFDFDGDGLVTSIDFLRFRLNFLSSI